MSFESASIVDEFLFILFKNRKPEDYVLENRCSDLGKFLVNLLKHRKFKDMFRRFSRKGHHINSDSILLYHLPRIFEMG